MSTSSRLRRRSTTARNLTITLFLVFVAITLGITIWASRQTKTATDFYAGGRSFSGFQNGMAIGGDYMSAASFLGIAGIIALYGYDGFLYSIGFLVAWLVALLLVAELLRNSGRYTMADVLAFRMRQRPVRTAAAVSTDHGVDLLPAGPDGRRRRAGGAAARHQAGHHLPRHGRRHREDRHDHPGRRPDDHLRHGRRHEGHHLRPDRQGVPADGRRAGDDGAGAGALQVQPVGAARRRRRRSPARATAFLEPGPAATARRSPATRRRPSTTRWTCSRSASRWCSAPPACRTS